LLRAEQVKARAAAKPIDVKLFASDRNPKAVATARINARKAGVEDAITFSVRDIAEFEAPAGPGVMLMNPPYGERMGEADKLAPLYKLIGDTLKHKAKGMEAYVFTAHGPLIKSIGLRPSRRTILRNGPLECRLLRFEMY
jgi:putative N6-adenine-specific DNA methylase